MFLLDFDNVNHGILFGKLEKYGILSSIPFQWLTCDLINEQQFVDIKNAYITHPNNCL